MLIIYFRMLITSVLLAAKFYDDDYYDKHCEDVLYEHCDDDY